MKTALFLSSFLVLLSVQAGERLVGRTDYDQPAEWARKPFLGRDFFPILSGVYWAAVGAKDVPEGYTVYTESGLRIGGPLPQGVNDLVPTNGRDVGGAAPQGYARLLPEAERRKEPYRLWDFFRGNNKDRAGADRLYGTDWIDRPFLLSLGGERPAFRLNAAYPLADRADFADFHAKHPNHMGNYAMMEFDSDLAFYFINFPKTTDGEALVRLQRAFPCTFKDWAWDANVFDRWIDEAKRRSVEFCFGDDNLWGFTSGTPGLVPLFARAGFKGVCYEATTQGGHANWRYAAAFLRGAARQFGMAYGWYTANFYDGVKRGSEKIEAGENAFGPVKGYKAFGLNRGASYEIIDRQNAYGWLIGARFVEPENWYHYHMQPVGDGRKAPSAAAKDFQALYDLSKREDRGLAYAPLALLMPIHEKVQGNGSQLYFTGFRQSAALATLVPSCPVRDFRKKGIEGGFYNSEFGEIFDIVSADATNDVDRTLAALRPYKAAALFGRFRPKDVAPAAFTRYAEEGGTLFVSEEYVAEGIVESAASGVTFPGRRILAAGEELVDDRGHRLPLKEPYVIRVGEPTTAKVLWTDERGQPVAYVNRVGKGRVITVAVDGMLPEGGWTQSWGVPDAARHNKEFSRIYHGEITFELMRAVFRRIQEETMPFAVAGDIHWGVNRTKDGWLLWMFNNKGITNYIDEAPVVDHGCDATVTVRPAEGVTVSSVREIRSNVPVTVSADGFTVTVPAGGWAAYAIDCN